MLDRLKRFFIWLSRINHCKGFGVQSPSAYHFICDVINGTVPFSKVEDFKAQFGRFPYNIKRLCGLYYRMSMSLQPDVVLNFDHIDEPYKMSFLCSSNELKFFQVNVDMEDEMYNHLLDHQHASSYLIRVALEGRYEEFLRTAVAKASIKTIIIVEGIHQNSKIRALWKEIQNDGHTSVTFDLYYCGIIFFDSRLKQHYIVNF